MLNARIQGTVLVIGRTAELDPGRAFGRHLLFQHLHQAGLADAGLAAKQDDLSGSRLGLRPALSQEPNLLLAAHQWGQSGGDRYLKAALHATLPQHLVDRDRGGNALERVKAEVPALEVTL